LEEALQTYPNSSLLSRLKETNPSVVNQDTFHINVESAFKLDGLIVENKETLPRVAGTSEIGERMLRTIEQGVSPSLYACTRVLSDQEQYTQCSQIN